MRCDCDCASDSPCGCSGWCEPGRTANRPGLDLVAFGSSRYGEVLRRMRQRLSGDDLPGLAGLTSRGVVPPLDPAIALLDCWACLSEVLGFYNERGLNESFLRTCIQRRSAVELARLVGYEPRPGLAADAWLAFTLDDLDKDAVLQVPAGTRAYSQPAPGETMQPFETDEGLTGRPRWSLMRPRLTIPQWLVTELPDDVPAEAPTPQLITADDVCLWFKGTNTGLVPGSVLLFDDDAMQRKLGRLVALVEPLPKGSASPDAPILEDQTRVVLQAPRPFQPTTVQPEMLTTKILQTLVARPGRYTSSQAGLWLNPLESFADASDVPAGLLRAVYPQLRDTLARALGGTTPAGASGRFNVYAMRVRAALHGHNAPLIANVDPRTGRVTSYSEWNPDGTGRSAVDAAWRELGHAVEEEAPLLRDLYSDLLETAEAARKARQAHDVREIFLDAVYEGILPGSQVVVLIPEPTDLDERPARTSDVVVPETFSESNVFNVLAVRTVTRVRFNLAARVTQVTLDRAWRPEVRDWSELRNVVVYARSEQLDLVERPLRRTVHGTTLVLDGHYPGLQPGRRLIVSGERADLGEITGVHASELVMVRAVAHRSQQDDAWVTRDTIHTYLELADPGLRHRFRRNTVTVYGNVAHASHGESRAEVLGSGNAALPAQVFPLKQTPVTYVPATTPTGVRSTLAVRVNDLPWRQATNAAQIAPTDRSYLLRVDDGGARAQVITGLGARVPSGRDNVRATYRSGLGSTGNLQPGQVSVLASRPNGVMGVTNPFATSGGTDADDLAAIKLRAPMGLSSLDRLVSAPDYADFARAFAGIGKAGVSWVNAQADPVEVTDPAATAMVLTLAGVNDAPLSADSALLRSLAEALARYGDLELDAGGRGTDVLRLRTRNQPALGVTLRIRTARLVALRARVRLEPGQLWDALLPKLEAALLARLGFDARELGQDLAPVVALAALHQVRGVRAVDLQRFGTLAVGSADAPVTPAELAENARLVLGGPDLPRIPELQMIDDATIAYLPQAVAGTVLLSEWEGA